MLRNNMEKRIVIVSEQLWKEILPESLLTEAYHILADDDLKGFFAYNLLTYADVYLSRLFLRGKAIFERMTLKDWLYVLEKITMDSHKFRYFLGFFYKYVCIDLYKSWEAMDAASSQQYREIYDWACSLETLFGFSRSDLVQLESCGLNEDAFAQYALQLVTQGGISCTRIPIRFPTLDE